MSGHTERRVTRHRRGALGIALAVLAVTLGAIGIASSAPPFCEPPGGDAGGTQASATPTTTPTACVGTLGNTSDVDYYAFPVPDGKSIVASMRSALGPVSRFALGLEQAGGPPGSCTNTASASVCRQTFAAGGTWYATVGHIAGPAGDYVLEIAVVDPLQASSCESGGDAGSTQGTATAIAPPVACGGTMANTSDVDYYTFTTQPGQIVVAALRAVPPLTEFQLELEGPGSVECAATSQGDVCRNLLNAPPGAWFLKVTHRLGGTGDYVLAVDVI